MNNKYDLSDDAVKAFENVIDEIKKNRKVIRFTKTTKEQKKLQAGRNFSTKWNKNTIQKAADFITSLNTNDALSFWQSIGAGPNANHNIAKLHIAISSDGVLVKDHLINILTKE